MPLHRLSPTRRNSVREDFCMCEQDVAAVLEAPSSPAAPPGFPVFLNLTGKRAVVAGEGEWALPKAEALAASGAEVHLFTTDTMPELAAGIVHHRRAIAAKDLAGAALRYAVFRDAAQAAATVALARRCGVLVGAVDQPALSDFTTPAVIRRGPVRIAISTGGAAPALARNLRIRIERVLPDALGPLVELCGAWRARVIAAIKPFEARRRFWDAVIDGPAAEALHSGDVTAAEAWMEKALSARQPEPRQGRAILVGAGPGGVASLTLAATRALQHADLILHDRLVGPEIRELARREAAMIDVGKRCGRHAMKQTEINRLLVEAVSAGKWVVRLKGGDPLVFARGGEEIEALRAAGLPYEIVPGVTAALAVAARLGMPLTERGLASSLHFLTAHSQAGALPDHDWRALAALGGTLAVYMGVRTLPRLAEKLIAAGMDPQTPAIAVENATLPEERRIAAPLCDLGGLVAAAAVSGPTLILIGRVVALATGTTGSVHTANGDARLSRPAD